MPGELGFSLALPVSVFCGAAASRLHRPGEVGFSSTLITFLQLRLLFSSSMPSEWLLFSVLQV